MTILLLNRAVPRPGKDARNVVNLGWGLRGREWSIKDREGREGEGMRGSEGWRRKEKGVVERKRKEDGRGEEKRVGAIAQ